MTYKVLLAGYYVIVNELKIEKQDWKRYHIMQAKSH